MYTDEYTVQNRSMEPEHSREHPGGSDSPAYTILTLVDEIRGLFRNHFESGWFLTILDSLSFNAVYLNDIRRLTELNSIYPEDIYLLKTGTLALEEFIAFTRRYVLPGLRDKLGISGFTRPSMHNQDHTTRVVKELFAAAFPHNIDHLSILTKRLKEATNRYALDTPVPQLTELSFAGNRPLLR